MESFKTEQSSDTQREEVPLELKIIVAIIFSSIITAEILFEFWPNSPKSIFQLTGQVETIIAEILVSVVLILANVLLWRKGVFAKLYWDEFK